MESMKGPVVFFDLYNTILRRTTAGWEIIPGAEALLDLSEATRLGVLCNLSPGHTRQDLKQLLQSVGLYDRFTPELVIVASELPTPLPDRRAFAVAAALAEVPIEQCVFVSASISVLIAAAAAGARTFQVNNATAIPASSPVAQDEAGEPTLLAMRAAAPAVDGSLLLAGEVDEDTGPTFVLKGRIVTMIRGQSGGVIDRGWIAVRKGKIAAIGSDATPIPAPFNNAVTLDTAGTIYPGLIDLHNHLAYDVLPLWKVPKQYTNRGQWPRHKEYAPQVQLPINVLGAYAPTARSIVRYIEAKALIGGTTSAQGVRSKQGGMTKLYRGAMRNIEQTDDPRLPEAGSKVLNYKRGNAKDTAAFKSALSNHKAYFYHLSEGTDDEARSHFTDLVQANLIGPALVGIHSLGLTGGNLRTLAQKGAKVIWSPFSNLLLYGKTLDLKALKESEVLFAIGCDWAPTGSKNLLEELKVARDVSNKQGGVLTSQDLVEAATASAAQILAWDQFVGTLKNGAFADLVVIAGVDGDPYDHLIDAVEAKVSLVVVHGTPRYGDAAMMTKLHTDAAHPPEALKIGGVDKSFYAFSTSSPLNDLSLSDATKILKEAMADLPAFKEKSENDTANLLALGADTGFALELDNEYDLVAETPTESVASADGGDGGELLAPGATVAKSIELDELEVNIGTYWDRVAGEANIGDLGKVLKDAYK